MSRSQTIPSANKQDLNLERCNNVIVWSIDLGAASRFLGPSLVVEADFLSSCHGRLIGGIFGLHVSLAHESINFGEDSLESSVDTGCVQGGGFNESQIVLFRKSHGFVGFHGSQMSKIGFVSDEHHYDVGFGVVSQLLEPALDIFESTMLGNVVDQQRAHSTAVVGRSNSTVAFLTSSVPNLSLDGLAFCLDRLGGEFDTNGGLAFQVEFIAGETRQQVGLSNAGVTDQHNFEKVVILFVDARHVDGLLVDDNIGKCPQRDGQGKSRSAVGQEKIKVAVGLVIAAVVSASFFLSGKQ